MSHITFMTEKGHIVKSSFDPYVTHASRIGSVCTHNFLHPTSPIYIVSDLWNDINHKDSPFIADPPYIRFYAGASIFVDGVKVGVLMVLGLSPNCEFNSTQQGILIELAACISDLLRVRRSEFRQKVMDHIHVHQSTLYSLKAPLNDAADSTVKIDRLLRVVRNSRKTKWHENNSQEVENESIIDYRDIQNQTTDLAKKVDSLSQTLQVALNKLQKELLPLRTSFVLTSNAQTPRSTPSLVSADVTMARSTTNKKLKPIPFSYAALPLHNGP